MKEGCLSAYVARGVYEVTDAKKNKKTQEMMYMKQIIFTRRPWWSAVGPELFALPGGKIEEQDFLPLVAAGKLTLEELENPDYVPSEELIILAAEETVKREFLEELGEGAAEMVAVGLIYIGRNEEYDPINEKTWITHTYAKHGTKKVTLDAKGNADGVVWENVPHIQKGDSDLKFLAKQFDIAAEAVNVLKNQSAA